MPKPTRITRMPRGAADLEKQEVHFTLDSSFGKQIECVAKVNIVEQIIAALAPIVLTLREKAGAQEMFAERVASSFVRYDPMREHVVMRLTTDKGVTQTFAFPRSVAASIADQLRTESEQEPSVGQA